MLSTTEEKKPSLWNQALKAVKGDSTNELVEQFTNEMTLVAEGLCEDQARLRKAVDGLIRQSEGLHDKTAQDYIELSRRLEASEADVARLNKDVQALSRRVEELSRPRARARQSDWKALFSGDLIGRVTLLASIVCGTWLAVTILNLFI